MKKPLAFILGAAVALMSVSLLADAQSSPKRRTPVLTNDDLGSAPRELIRSPAKSEVQPLSSAGPEAARGPIAWHRDLRRALEVEKADGKLVVADVYTDWCGWCKRMDATIYSHPAIVALSRQQVFVKVNAEDQGQGQDFAAQMGVKGYPTTIVLDEQGRVLNVARGYIASPRAFVEFVDSARAAQFR